MSDDRRTNRRVALNGLEVQDLNLVPPDLLVVLPSDCSPCKPRWTRAGRRPLPESMGVVDIAAGVLNAAFKFG